MTNPKLRQLAIFSFVLLSTIISPTKALMAQPIEPQQKVEAKNQDPECFSRVKLNDLIFKMASRYVPVITKTMDGKIIEGSAVIVNSTTVVTSQHLIQPFGETSLANNPIPDVVVEMPRHDLVFIIFPRPTFNFPPLEPATVEQGERVYEISNAYALNGIYEEYVVAKVTPTLIFTKPAIDHGASGAAVFNGKGQIIGISAGIRSDSGEEGLGFIVPVSFFEKILNPNLLQSTK